MKLLYRKGAISDLDSIFDYTAKRWDRDQAATYLGSFDAIFDSLLTNPARGTIVETRRYAYRRLAHRSHAIYFRETNSQLIIARVLHQSMDADRHLP